MDHTATTDPTTRLLPRVQPPRRTALAMHEREPAWQVLPLYSQSGTYREWGVTVAGTEYCIVDEHGDWFLVYYVPDIGAWCDAPDDPGSEPGAGVDVFLSTHRLMLED